MPIPAYRMPGLLQPMVIPRFQGLLEGRAFGLPGPGAGGLLQPAMWDRVRQQQGLLGPYGTEGGGRGMAGGGGMGELPLQGGSVGSRNVRHSGGDPAAGRPTFDWAYSEMSGRYNTTLPSGVKVDARPTWSNTAGRDNLNVEFSWGGSDRYGAKSTKRAIGHLTDV